MPRAQSSNGTALAAQSPASILIACGGIGTALGKSVGRTHFAVIRATPATAGLWDYAWVDPESRRLYLADSWVLSVSTLAARKVTPQLVRGNLTHGIVPLGHGIAAGGGWHPSPGALKIFMGRAAGSSRRYRPANLRARLTVNGDSGTLALDRPAEECHREGAIRVGGKLEFAVAGKNGTVYVNVASRNELAVIDVMARQVSRRVPLPGLAYDPEFDLHAILGLQQRCGRFSFSRDWSPDRAGRHRQRMRCRVARRGERLRLLPCG